jgi:hypothetical protein
MPIYVTWFIQLLLIIHVLKTGRNRYWIFILLFLPLIGGAAYLVVEVLPEFMGSVSGQRARRGMQQLIDPGGDIRACARAWEQSPNAENGRRYAQSLISADKADEALGILQQARSGFFENDPTLLLLEAQGQFLKEDWKASLEALQRLKAENPDFHSAEADLLRARALEADGRREEAIALYRGVAGYFPGVEARYRFAVALGANGEKAEAREEFEGILRDAQLAPPHFRRSQRSWISEARKALKSLG